MPQMFDIKRILSSRSDRVKSIDIHPTEPWMCTALYNGNVHIWNIDTQTIIKTFEVCTSPVRCAKFVARKNWLITASDDMQVRVFNYNTIERVHQFEAHSDYIRCIVVHPTQPFVLTSSDDMLIRLWDWEKNWVCAQTFEGHSHYVMQVVLNPKDNNTFASASLDKTIKVWGLGTGHANFTLEGHEKGVNCVDYYATGDKPYLVSGADDRTVKIWDYQTKSCVQTLEGHSQNISAVAFHPELPVVLTGSEDGTVRVWHASTYRLESTLNYGLERVWSLCCTPGKQTVGIGYDEGAVVISLGREEPVMSMDASGKLVCARHAELVQANLRQLMFGGGAGGEAGGGGEGDELKDGERLPVAFKQMGTCEVYPATLEHNANGCFVAVCGDGEYIVYTAMALRNKAFGQAQQFVWSSADPNVYAIRESNTVVRVFKSFKETRTFRLEFGAEAIFGGHLLGVRSVAGLSLYDWETGVLVRRIETTPQNLHWNEGGRLLAVCTQDAFFVLRYHADTVQQAIVDGKLGGSNDNDAEAEGLETAFEMVRNGEVGESVRSACWYGDAFLFTSAANRLRYYVGGELVTVAHLDKPAYLLGYLAKANCVCLADRELGVFSYRLLTSVLEYETAVMRGDFACADGLLGTIPRDQRSRIGLFLERQGFKAQAMRVTTDPDHKFELALQLDDLVTAQQIAEESDKDGGQTKWRQLAEAACRACRFDLAQECLSRTGDQAGLLLLATSTGNSAWLAKLAGEAAHANRDNIAFLARFLLADLDGCLDLLVSAGRLPEAAFFARAYLPSRVPDLVERWRTSLAAPVASANGATTGGTKTGQAKAAHALASPADYPNLFPGLQDCLAAEKWLAGERASHTDRPASSFPSVVPVWQRHPIEEMKQQLASSNISSTVPLAAPLIQAQQEKPVAKVKSLSPVPLSPTVKGVVEPVAMATIAVSGGSSGVTIGQTGLEHKMASLQVDAKKPLKSETETNADAVGFYDDEEENVSDEFWSPDNEENDYS